MWLLLHSIWVCSRFVRADAHCYQSARQCMCAISLLLQTTLLQKAPEKSNGLCAGFEVNFIAFSDVESVLYLRCYNSVAIFSLIPPSFIKRKKKCPTSKIKWAFLHKPFPSHLNISFASSCPSISFDDENSLVAFFYWLFIVYCSRCFKFDLDCTKVQ